MKNIKTYVFTLGMVFFLAACAGNNPGPASQQSGGQSNPADKGITLIAPEDTSMVSEKVKAYVDAMREQEKSLADPYKYDDLFGENGITVENFLDEGEVASQNRTVSGSIPDRSDKSMGVNLSYTLSEELEASDPKTIKIVVSKNSDLSDAKEIYTTLRTVNVNNLFVNTEYYWQVQVGSVYSEIGTFRTGDYPRWITARPMYNVRDNGGYMTVSGKRVKQGLVYRGGEITNRTWQEHLLTNAESSKKAFREVMNIGVELDLRGPSDIGDGYNACAFAENGDIDYVQLAIKSYEQTFTQTRSNVAPIFEILKDADKKPVYYHCYGGADRTGTIGFLLNGLLGVSYTDLVIDFELTSYSSINNEHIRNHIPGHQHQYDRWPKLIEQLQTDTTGGYAYDASLPLHENIENFLVKACSVPQETINTIRSIMLED